MSIESDMEEAEKRAKRRVPKPQYEPASVAFTTFFVTGVIIALFSEIAKLPEEATKTAVPATVLIMTVGVNVYLWLARKRYDDAFSEEYAKIVKEKSDQRAERST